MALGFTPCFLPVPREGTHGSTNDARGFYYTLCEKPFGHIVSLLQYVCSALDIAFFHDTTSSNHMAVAESVPFEEIVISGKYIGKSVFIRLPLGQNEDQFFPRRQAAGISAGGIVRREIGIRAIDKPLELA